MHHQTIFDTVITRNLLYWLARLLLNGLKWHTEGRLPDLPKYVLIAAPHTSNWDFPLTLVMAFAFKAKIFWMGKDSLFRWPFGGFLKWLGGIPVDRTMSSGLVAQVVQAFHDKEEFVVAIAPEGTRKKVKYWKTGFYYIAQGAQVPVVLGYLDYRRKIGGIGPTFFPTGNIEPDMESIQAFYTGITARHPDKSDSERFTSIK
jgi:1-acyl-sn-glycerol-3-phosphate acyltransferase